MIDTRDTHRPRGHHALTPLTEKTANFWKPVFKYRSPTLPDNEPFLRFKNAVQFSGATPGQISYLAGRGVVRTKDSDTGIHRYGHPEQSYAIHDLMAVKQALEESNGQTV